MRELKRYTTKKASTAIYSILLLALAMTQLSCTPKLIRVYSQAQIPSDKMNPVHIDLKPIVLNIDIFQNYSNLVQGLQICNARIDYIRNYINEYNAQISKEN